MNFCAGILISKIEEICNIFGILCFIISRKWKYQKRFAMYGEGAGTDETFQKWLLAKFLGAIDILAK